MTPRSTPIRIAQLANFVGPTSGGMKVAVGHLGAGYVAAGAERLLVVPGPVTTMRHTPEGIVMTVRARQVPGGYRMILDARPVLDALEAFGPTSIELSDKWTLTAALGWARRRGVPTALFSHERLDAMLPLRLGLERGLTRPIAMYNTLLRKRADAIVVTSDFAAQEFRRLTPANPAPIHRVPLGVDLDGFRPPCAPPPDDGMIRLVHVGRLSREKHPHLAVRTALALHARGIPVRLDVYGEGPHRQELEALAGSGPVTFHGHLPDRHALARAIGGAHASLSVSPGETFGLAVLEALACGTPVVTADRGGARELITARCGAWAPPDPEALADAVLTLIEPHAPRLARRPAARRQAERYPWARTVERMLAIHGGLAAEARTLTAHSA